MSRQLQVASGKAPGRAPGLPLFPQTYRDPQVDNLLLSLYRSADSLPIRDRPSRSKPLIDSPSWAYVFARGGCFVPRLMFPTVPVPSGVPSRSIWERLYQRAILELDYAKVPERIAEARHAMHDRAEEILTESSSNERGALNKALRNLSLLEEVTARETSME